MKSTQRDLAQRVWSRVQPVSMQERQSLQKMVCQLEEDIGYLKTLPGQPTLARLLEELKGQAVCLRGLHVIAAGNAMKTPPARPTAGWKQCYYNALQRQKEYLLRSADPQFAPVYTQLAKETREHCVKLLQLAGEGQDGGGGRHGRNKI